MTNRQTIPRVCAMCSKEFAVPPSRLRHGRGRHCSPACQHASRRAAPRRVATFKCVGCGGDGKTAACRIGKTKGAGKFCSRKCRDEHWRGPLNPLWQDGSGVYKRGSRWHATRRRIVARDGGQCQHCGSSDRLHVHHGIPFRMFAVADVANGDWNLTTLCGPCHRREEARFRWALIGGSAIRFNKNSRAWDQYISGKGF